jgi:hypothetical protein
MLARHALLVAVLVSGTATLASAQSDEFPFRRFGSRSWVMPRFEVRPFRFDSRNMERFQVNADRIRQRAQEMAERARTRSFYLRDNLMQQRNRAFAMRDEARRQQMELRLGDRDLMRERLRDRLYQFRLERPMIMRRHSRTI